MSFYAKGWPPPPTDDGRSVHVRWVSAEGGEELSETYVPLTEVPADFELLPGQQTTLHGAPWRIVRVEPAASAQWRASRSLLVWIRKVVPASQLQEVEHHGGTARFRVLKDWTVQHDAHGDTVVDVPGIGRLRVRASVADASSAVRDDADRRATGLSNGCTLRSWEDDAPQPARPSRRVRQWEITQPLDGQVRLITFTFDYDVGWRHEAALDALEQEIPQTAVSATWPSSATEG